MRVETATGYSFPSGHTQTATTFWTSLAVQLKKKKWVYVLAVVMAVGAGISRLYLAVHWPMSSCSRAYSWIFIYYTFDKDNG